VGIINLIFSVFRLGVVAQLLSHSVLVGFTSGAAVVIGLSQLKHIMGFSIPTNPFPLYKLGYALGHIGDINVASFVMTLITVVILVALRSMKRWIVRQEKAERSGDKVPLSTNRARARSVLKVIGNMNALIVVLLGTSITSAVQAQFGAYTVKVVGVIEPGYPAPRVPAFGAFASDIPKLMVPALIISVLGFIESYAVGTNYAKQNGYKVDADQELVALGTSNLIGSFFNSFPVTGGFSRTAVNADSGASTPVASIVSALVIVFVLFVLTDALVYLPKPVLAGIIIVAVTGLFNISAVKLAWRVSRRDFAVIAATFCATVGFGVEIGIIVGLGASFANVLQGFSRPHCAVLGKVTSPDTGETLYRNLKRYSQAQVDTRSVIVRVDAPIWFANAQYVQTVIRTAATEPVCAVSMLTAESSSSSSSPQASTVVVPDEGGNSMESADVVAGTGSVPADTAASGERRGESDKRESARFVVVDFSAVDSIDITGLETLVDLQDELNGLNIGLVCAAVKGPVRDRFIAFNVQHQKAHRNARPFAPWIASRDMGGSPMNVMTRTIGEAEELIEAELRKEEVASTLDVRVS
jgi:MFS superfamily sulfate permease-like transporter